MIKLILTILVTVAFFYLGLWVSHNFTETRTQVQCKIDYGLKGCNT